ncbi:MAG: response regulator [Gemmatimonadetes bacterium]|nr:MAG: response regulator [Gemmatimonadota bacterium]
MTTESTSKARIMIVDDDDLILTLVSKVLELNGYTVSMNSNGKQALENVEKFNPDLVILDVMMPEMDGLEVCRRLQQNVFTRHIPIIFLSAMNEVGNKVEALYAGGNDFVTKPFINEELIARVDTVLKRQRQYLDANPLTRLPGYVSRERELAKRIIANEKFAVCYTDLDQFKAYNDKYGFQAGDKVLFLTAQIISDAVSKLGNPDDFVGHIGGDDFIFVTTPDRMHAVCQRIVDQFDEKIKAFFRPEDLERGYFISENRQGEVMQFPIMTITIVVITNVKRTITHPGQIGDIEGELKGYAKKLPGSNIVIDKRSDDLKETKITPVRRVLVGIRHKEPVNLLAEKLGLQRFQLVFAESGPDVLSMMVTENPDGLLLFNDMPIIRGEQLIKLIRHNPDLPNPSLPIVLVGVPEGSISRSEHIEKTLPATATLDELTHALKEVFELSSEIQTPFA